MQERLQKIIARAGVTSRRAAEELVASGRVRVNGLVVNELGAKADPFQDKIEVDGRRLVPEDQVYLVLHKPRNVVATMSDPEGRPTVAEILRGVEGRVYPVGRLDFATSGVLLATNDGEFANGLLHPNKAVPKTYVVKALGVMSPADLDVWRRGVALDDGMTLPADVRFLRHDGDKTWFEITLREGRNQQIRRMGEATGFRVGRLARISFASITSEGLRPGDFRHLTRDELLALRETYGVPKRVRGVAGATGAKTSVRAGRPTRAAGPSTRGKSAGRERADDAPVRRAVDASQRTPRAAAGRHASATRGEEVIKTTHDRTTASRASGAGGDPGRGASRRQAGPKGAGAKRPSARKIGR